MNDKEKNICKVVKAFLEHPDYTNVQLSQLTGISSSSVQRHLTDPTIIKLFNEETYNKIQELLNKHLEEGRKKGGVNYFKNNDAIKDENGKFVGSKKTDIENKLEKKRNDILIFANVFLAKPNSTLQDIADFYNRNYPEYEPVTKDYVYDCLTNKASYSWVSDDLYNTIYIQLKERGIINNKSDEESINKSK